MQTKSGFAGSVDSVTSSKRICDHSVSCPSSLSFRGAGTVTVTFDSANGDLLRTELQLSRL